MNTMQTTRLMRAVGLAAVALTIAQVATLTQAQQAGAASDVPQAPAPTASDGGKVELLPPRPVPDSADPVTQLATTQTVDGLVLVVTIDGTAVTLDSAAPARIPRRQARDARPGAGDVVKAMAYAGGRLLATTMVPDNVLNASEGGGLVRTTRRQIALVLAVDRAADTVSVEALATGARATLDVRAAYARLCEADRDGKWCPRPPR